MKFRVTICLTILIALLFKTDGFTAFMVSNIITDLVKISSVEVRDSRKTCTVITEVISLSLAYYISKWFAITYPQGYLASLVLLILIVLIGNAIVNN